MKTGHVENFTFTTPETDNTYIIRFSSTGNGWAKFRQYSSRTRKTETSLLTVGTQDREAYAYLNLDAERFQQFRTIDGLC